MSFNFQVDCLRILKSIFFAHITWSYVNEYQVNRQVKDVNVIYLVHFGRTLYMVWTRGWFSVYWWKFGNSTRKVEKSYIYIYTVYICNFLFSFCFLLCWKNIKDKTFFEFIKNNPYFRTKFHLFLYMYTWFDDLTKNQMVSSYDLVRILWTICPVIRSSLLGPVWSVESY